MVWVLVKTGSGSLGIIITVAILAQGTSWADAVTQAYYKLRLGRGSRLGERPRLGLRGLPRASRGDRVVRRGGRSDGQAWQLRGRQARAWAGGTEGRVGGGRESEPWG